MLVCYAPDLSNYHELRVVSFQTEEFYNDIGTFTLLVAATDYNINAISIGSILYDTSTKSCFLVERINPDTTYGRITVNGSTNNKLLSRRCFYNNPSIDNVETGIYTAITDNLRSLPNVEISEASGLLESLPCKLDNGSIPDIIIPVLDAVSLGHIMTFNYTTKKHVFKIYKGEDLTTGNRAVIFSAERGTARALKIDDDNSSFKNVCYALATDKNDDAYNMEIGTATGADRYEFWLDTKVKQESDETTSAFQARIQSKAAEEFAKRIRRTSFTVTVDSSDYGTAYNLGDIVKCVSKQYAVQFNAAITGVKRTITSSSETMSIVLGDPILDVIGELKLNGNN